MTNQFLSMPKLAIIKTPKSTTNKIETLEFKTTNGLTEMLLWNSIRSLTVLLIKSESICPTNTRQNPLKSNSRESRELTSDKLTCQINKELSLLTLSSLLSKLLRTSKLNSLRPSKTHWSNQRCTRPTLINWYKPT